MGFEDFLTVKLLSAVSDEIDSWETPFFRGLAYVALFLIIVWILLYFLFYGAFSGHLSRTIWLLGIWIAVELINFIGGGHSEKEIRSWKIS